MIEIAIIALVSIACGVWIGYWAGAHRVIRIRHTLERWARQQGHDACWYYPDVFRSVASIVGANVSLDEPDLLRSEFRRGCERFEKERHKETQ